MEVSNSPQEERPEESNLLLGIWRQFSNMASSFLGERFSIIDLADPASTIEGIKKDVEFRGFRTMVTIINRQHQDTAIRTALGLARLTTGS